MEDALVLNMTKLLSGRICCLNPCFNGRCTRTHQVDRDVEPEVSLNPCFNGRCTRTCGSRLLEVLEKKS